MRGITLGSMVLHGPGLGPWAGPGFNDILRAGPGRAGCGRETCRPGQARAGPGRPGQARAGK